MLLDTWYIWYVIQNYINVTSKIFSQFQFHPVWNILLQLITYTHLMWAFDKFGRSRWWYICIIRNWASQVQRKNIPTWSKLGLTRWFSRVLDKWLYSLKSDTTGALSSIPFFCNSIPCVKQSNVLDKSHCCRVLRLINLIRD